MLGSCYSGSLQQRLSQQHMTSTFEWHQRSPEISLETYVSRARIALGKALTCKTLVYLDTNYWIMLRQAANDAEANRAHTGLLDMLRRRVASGVLLCPISASTFLELMKQADPRSRLSTSSLIDELSRGVAKPLISGICTRGTENCS